MAEPIALIGSSCRLPGASSPSKLWQLLKNPKDLLADIPKDRLNLGAFYHENGEHHGSTDVVAKAYLLDEDPRLFDCSFFNINPMEAEAMDPQQRILLESVYECIESAGYPLAKMQGSATSVYVGCMTNDYHDIQGRDMEAVNRYHGTGTTRSILSNRISYVFDLRGPSVTLDTACSSSLVALHFAVQSLRNGESTSSIVAGVNLIFDSVAYISESKLHMLSPTSRSRMWDAGADGYARGEGVSAVMLKTLSQALADGDHIECIIRETGVNQDGRTVGMTMPSGEAQASLIRETYARAGLDLRLKSDRPQYFEAHGTGTLAGDPQEARGIYSAFFDSSMTESADEETKGVSHDERLLCGSIKSVIGHLEGCAGLAGLLKASLAVQHGLIPPNLLFNSLNPEIGPFYHRLQVPTQALAWPTLGSGSPRRASVNSFGFGGTNVHAIIEQYVPSISRATRSQSTTGQDFFAGPLLLSAGTGPSLATSVGRVTKRLEEDSRDISLDDLAFFTQTRRTAFQQRISFPGGTRTELVEALRAATSGASSDIGSRAPSKLKWHTPGILGIFTGQGVQWAAMGRDMIQRCHLFRQSIEECETSIRSLPDAPTWSLLDELSKDNADSRLHEAALSQPLCTAIQIALVDTLAAAGITFRGVVGHSSGEIAATYAAGLLSAKDAMRVAFYRGLYAHLAQGEQGQRGSMLAVGLGIDDSEAFCKPFNGRLGVAASNSPTSTTLSGDEDAVLEAKAQLDEDKTFARILKVDTAYHSAHMLPCAKPYLDALKACKIQVQPQNDDCIWISSVHGHAELLDYPEDLGVLANEYWVANMCQPVFFSDAVECSLWRAGPFDLVIEVGAHHALKGPANQTISAALGVNGTFPYVATLQRGRNDVEAFSASLGSIWTTLGSWVNFDGWRKAYLGPDCPPTVPALKNLPGYSWTHERPYWKESRLSSRYRLAERTPHELLGRRAPDDTESEMRWRNFMKVNELPWVKGHVFQKAILFPTTGYVNLAIEAAAEIAGGVDKVKLIEVRDLVIPRALVLEENNIGVETVFSVRRQPSSSTTTIEADWACHSSVNNNALEKNASGYLIIELFGSDNAENDKTNLRLPIRCPPRSGTTSIDGEAYYQAVLKTTGLDYQGLFRATKHIRRTLGFSTSHASWPVEDVGNRYLLHPGPTDVSLQAILAAIVNPTRIPIRGSFLPSALARLVFDPHARTVSEDGQNIVLESDCFLTNNTARSCEGDIHVFGPTGQCLLQAEGFRMDNWVDTSAKEDRPVFSRLEYRPDLFYTNNSDLAELHPDDAEERLIEAVNRASFYYLRNFFSAVSDLQVAEWTWDRQAFYKAARSVLQQTLEGRHPVTKKAWLEDTPALMEKYKQTAEFQDQADMKAIHVAGDHLDKIMAGEVGAMEVYLRENVWAPLYSHGRYQVRLNQTISDLVDGFAHRYPRAKYLEVGAGSGGTTIGVLDQLGDALGQYTFTDISAGFFEKARERLSGTNAEKAGRITYKVLNLENDPLEQEYEPESYDVIIAANVLHAITDLNKAVSNVRRLLKPGGYLFMLEVTGEYLEGLLLMGPLEGWWLRNREGKTSQPGLTLKGWDDLLRNTGFTGVDKHQSDVPDSTTQAVSVIVAQATDVRVNMLREPLEFLDDVPITDQVLIIGGRSLALSKTVRFISQHVSRFAGRVQVVPSVEKIDPKLHLTGPTAVIALSDLERPFFSDPVTDTRLQKLQALFAQATDMLWVTTGHLDDQDPAAAMMTGLCRTVVVELEQLNLQFLNTTTKGSQPYDARFIVEAFVRLRLGSSDSFITSPILWAVEPELTLTAEGEVLVPRLKPDEERNDRLNSGARRITKAVAASDVKNHRYTAVPRDGHIRIEEDAPWIHTTKRHQLESSNCVQVRTTLSLALPHSSSRIILATGLDQDDNPVLALTDAHSSKSSVPHHAVLQLNTTEPCTAQQLGICGHFIVAKHILAAIPSKDSLRGSKVVIHGATPALAQTLSQLAAGDLQLVFTQATTRSQSMIPGTLRLHPKSSIYILRRSLPAKVGFVVALSREDPITHKLVSAFPGSIVDLDISLLNGSSLALAELNRFFSFLTDNEEIRAAVNEPGSTPAHDLTNLTASSLTYPSVIDWSVNDGHPWQVTVNPIHGCGLFSPDKSYFMVSLVSTLGRSLVRWMVENGARHIALASRSAKVDPAWLEEMAHLGANIRVFRMDVSDKASVQHTVAAIRAEMPPIAGVANAALVLKDGTFLNMKAPDMTEVLAPKVDGSLYLHEEFRDPALDFFILFSTLSCVIGNAGQSNYDAASLYQVMLAKHRRQQGLPASVMEVGAVADVGYVAERGQALFDKLARTMKLPLSESDVHQIFAEAVAASPVRAGEVIDSTTAELVTGMGQYTYSPNTPTEAHPPWYNNLLASHYVREEHASNVTATGGDANHQSVAARLDATTTEEEASNALTQALAARVETMLQMPPGSFKVDASLLDVGIDSLLAVELRTWFLKEVHVDVPVLKILSGESGQTVCAFAASQYLAEKGQDQSNTPPANADMLTAQRIGGAEVDVEDIKRSDSPDSIDTGDSGLATSMSSLPTAVEEQEHESEDACSPKALKETAPMTRAQARIWVADHISSNLTQNNNVFTYDVRGFVHVGRLSRAVTTVVAHHPGLHSCFFEDIANAPRQGIFETPTACFEHIPAADGESETMEVVKNRQVRLRTQKWRLQQGEALQVTLVSHTSKKHTLLIGYHHIAMDGLAWRTFFRDLHMAYQGVALQPIGKSLIEVAAQEAAQDLHASSKYWEQQLSPLPEVFPVLPFASVKTRPLLDGPPNHEYHVEMEGSIVERINAISRSLGVTPVNFYLAALQCLLIRLADTVDFCIGITDSGRDAETAESVGFFLNLLPLRLNMNDTQSFKAIVQQVAKTYLEARKHSKVPFDAILDAVGVGRDSTHTPLFQVGFDVRPGQSADIPLGNCQLKLREAIDSSLPYDIAFSVIPMPTSGPSYLQVFTRADVYSQQATELLAQMFLTLVQSAAQLSRKDVAFGDLEMYPVERIQKALEFGAVKSKTFAGWPSTITERIESIFQDHASSTAIRDSSGSMTYAELAKATFSLSARLLPFQGLRIAVLCEPQRQWVVGLLATLRLGATFVALDATLPPSRLTAVMQACGPSLILCQNRTKHLASRIVLESDLTSEILSYEDTLSDSVSSALVESSEDPTKASVILSTSGTTGVPKSILLTSGGFLNYLANQTEVHGVAKDEVVLQQSALGFDMAFAETLIALTHGSTLVIVPQTRRGDPVAITELMAEENVSYTYACPTEYLMWLRYGGEAISRCNTWRLANSGGEKVLDTLIREMRSIPSKPTFSDTYGPGETTCAATMTPAEVNLTEDPLTTNATPVGRPLDNVGIFIIDHHGHVCPPGVPGEIWITGAGVALGYIDPKATEQVFIDSFEAVCGNKTTVTTGRTYKSGDRGVWRVDGTLGFLGRLDDDTVVKIRGQRTDLRDVESTVTAQGAQIVSDIIVTAREQNDDVFLVAHVVPTQQSKPTEEADVPRLEVSLERFMQNLPLPRHMKPSRVVVLKELPVSTHGKADRRALACAPLPPRRWSDADTDDSSQMTTLRQVELHLLWQRTLGRDDIPRNTDVEFWAMGGSSLDLVKLQAAIRSEMLAEVTIRDLFMHSTLGSMAGLVSDISAERRARQSIDWEIETSLSDDLRVALRLSSAHRVTDGAGDVYGDILLTGADEFLGGHILGALLQNPAVQRVHCLAAFSSTALPASVDQARIVLYEDSSLQKKDFGLDADAIVNLMDSVGMVVIAGSYGHCLHNYVSLRKTNVDSTKVLAAWAARHRIPVHFISSARVTLLNKDAEASLPPVSVKDYQPRRDGSEGFTASKWAGEVFLERLAAEASKTGGSSFPITIHRPCALIGTGAPSGDALNAILRYSTYLSAVPRVAGVAMSGYFDFAPVEKVAADIAAAVVMGQPHSSLRFVHHSSGSRVPPIEFKGYMEKVHGKEFAELELEEWIDKAVSEGLEPMVAVYLRAVVGSGEEMVFPFLGTPATSTCRS